MRKFVSAILCILFLLSFCVSGYAANSATIYGNNIICANGERITVPVNLKNNTGIMGFRISVCYPEEVLSAEKVEYGEITRKGMFADNITENTNGMFDVVWSNSAGVKNDGTIFVITFNVSETATTGDYTISLSYSPDDTFDEKWNDSFLAKYNRTLTQNQFDAMVSFSFNVGEKWMSDTSYNINKYLRTGNYTDADFIETMQAWSNAGGSRLKGLVTRRTEEAHMFLYGEYPGGVVSKGTQNTQTHEIDTSYGKNITAYPKSKITASNIYNENHQNTSSSAWIGTSDKCTILEVYTDGCCKVTYPLDSGGTKTCYSKINLFNCEPLVKVPGNVNITLTTATEIPVGGIMTVTWTNASDADYYYVALKNSSGSTVQSTDNVKGNTASFTLNSAGTYTVCVTAKNSKYSGSESQLSSRVTAHNPLIVSFVDYDGNVINKQKVDYGTNAVVPSSPSRVGYTFTGWLGTYTNVKSDQTVTAQYTKNKYTVRFLDEDGKVLETQKVYYQDAAKAPNYQPPAGYEFSGWNRSFNSITEDTTVKAVVSWYNSDMSCLVSNVKAVRDSDGTGVTVTYSVSNQKGEITSARAIVALKSSTGKLVTTTESAAFSIKNNFTKVQEVFVPTTDAAYKVEVYIVANYKTAVPISASATAVIDQGTMNWSSWSTTKPSGIESTYIESRTEYRYRDKKYITSPSSSKSGWTLYDSSWAWSDYGSWSGWSDSYGVAVK